MSCVKLSAFTVLHLYVDVVPLPYQVIEGLESLVNLEKLFLGTNKIKKLEVDV